MRCRRSETVRIRGRVDDDCPEPVGDRNLAMGTRLWVAAEAFMFMAFLFAYFYLRTINSNGQWHPHGQNPSTGLGTARSSAWVSAVLLCGARRARSTAGAPMIVALAAGIGGARAPDRAAGQSRDSHRPHAGGYGSVFVGFTAMYVIHLTGRVVLARNPDRAGPARSDGSGRRRRADARFRR